MTQTTREIFEKYEIRKSLKQKLAFCDYVKNVAEKHGYKCEIEKGANKTNNIVVGDVDNAKVLYTAHYDTCAKMIIPNFITPTNFLIYLVYQILFIAVFLGIAFGLGYACGITFSYINLNENVELILSTFTPVLIYFILLFALVAGPANKHTANDNTSGVTTLIDIMTALPNELRDKVAFIFFDLEESGLLGSSAFAKAHKDIKENKLLINFDCVSDGETILFALKKSTRKYEELLKQAFVSNDDCKVEIPKGFTFYPSDNMNFKGGIGVAALKKAKRSNLLYMDRIHTKRDTVYREQNIEFLKNGAIRLAEIL